MMITNCGLSPMISKYLATLIVNNFHKKTTTQLLILFIAAPHLIPDPRINFFNLSVEFQDVLGFLKTTRMTLCIQHQPGPALHQVVKLILYLC